MNECKYCKSEKYVIIGKCTNEIYINNQEILSFCGWCGCQTKVKIKYCPFCR